MSDRDLVTDEGVDEGSAQTTVEGGGAPPTTVEGGGDDVLGEPPHGAPDDGEQDAAPLDTESEESRRVRAERGTGQQYQVGEG